MKAKLSSKLQHFSASTLFLLELEWEMETAPGAYFWCCSQWMMLFVLPCRHYWA